MQKEADNKAEGSLEQSLKSPKLSYPEKSPPKEPNRQYDIEKLFSSTANGGGSESPPEKFSSLLTNPLMSHPANSIFRDRAFYQIQQEFGNSYVQRMMEKSKVSSQQSPTKIQAKLKIGQPDDIYEQEADRVAEQVMRMPEPQVQLQQEEEEKKKEEEELIQTKHVLDQITPLVQRQIEEEEEEEEFLQPKEQPTQTPKFTSDLESHIRSLRGGGQPLPESTRDFMEPRFGHDFSQVRVHTNTEAAKTAKGLNARAFTVGPNVVFGTGEYAPVTTAGQRLIAHELTHVVQQSCTNNVGDRRASVNKQGDTYGQQINQTANPSAQCRRAQLNRLGLSAILFSNMHLMRQEADKPGSTKVKKEIPPTGGELAWEIFKPTVIGAIRSLAPGVLSSTRLGKHYKEVIEIISKLEDTTDKLREYDKKIQEIKKRVKGGEELKFILKSLAKVYRHIKSIPDSLQLDADSLIKEAAEIVTKDMFTNMPYAVKRLGTFATIVKETKKIRIPYRDMISKLTEAEKTVNASFEALDILQNFMENLVKLPLPFVPTFAMGWFLTIEDYKSDVADIRSALGNKRKGYERSIDASEKMEAYMNGRAGRKTAEEVFRKSKSPDCLARLKDSLPALKRRRIEPLYEQVLPYCDFDDIMDSLDFLPIEDSDGFFAITEGLRDAYPDREGTILRKEKRYGSGVWLAFELDQLRPVLEDIENRYDLLVMRFIFQEYYRFWRDDSFGRSLLSTYRFTYRFTIEQMRENVRLLIPAIGSFIYFTSD